MSFDIHNQMLVEPNSAGGYDGDGELVAQPARTGAAATVNVSADKIRAFLENNKTKCVAGAVVVACVAFGLGAVAMYAYEEYKQQRRHQQAIAAVEAARAEQEKRQQRQQQQQRRQQQEPPQDGGATVALPDPMPASL